jgi:hypothetical protein
MSPERVGFITVPTGAKAGFDHAANYQPGRRIYAAQPGAHTTCWDFERRCLYVFCPRSGGAAVHEERV